MGGNRTKGPGRKTKTPEEEAVETRLGENIRLARDMVGLSGDELARSIKRHRAGTSVLMVTGTGRQIQQSGGKLEGVDMVIGKPVGPRQVLEAVETLLSRSRDPGR